MWAILLRVGLLQLFKKCPVSRKSNIFIKLKYLPNGGEFRYKKCHLNKIDGAIINRKYTQVMNDYKEQFLDPGDIDKGFICFVCCEIKSKPEYNVDYYVGNNQVLLCEECNLDIDGCDCCECSYDPYNSITLIPPVDNVKQPVTEIKYWNKLCANCGNKSCSDITDFLRFYIMREDTKTIRTILEKSIDTKNTMIRAIYNEIMTKICKIKDSLE